ncbi:MAG: hypothetical protein ABQ298_14690 [Puniceicoccaceae bacterium]
MNDLQFDALIQCAKTEALPDCPESLEARVMQNVLQDREGRVSLWQQIRFAFAQPGLAIAMVVLTVAVSSGVTVLSSRYLDDATATREIASLALGFDVFQATDLLIPTPRSHE